MADFQKIMKDRGYWNDKDWHGTKHTYTFETGNILQFFSVDTLGKAHGPRRDVLFINECNNLPYNIVDQLITRTRETIWLDWNPSDEFWFYTEMLPNRTDIDFITLTYLDNEALDANTRMEIEAHKHDKAWWTVYGLGQLGIILTRIYRDWKIIDEIPYEARLERYGLDFGYTNDPTSIVAVYYYNGGYILDEVCYKKGMQNKDIVDILANRKSALVIADSAEPKSIDDIKAYDILISPTVKGKDSVRHGISTVQRQQISVTKNSVHIIKEFRHYLWMTDNDGKVLNEPVPGNDHALDAIRYAITSIVPIIRADEMISQMPRRDQTKKPNPAR